MSSLRIDGPSTVLAGTDVVFRAVAIYDDGSERDMTDVAVWGADIGVVAAGVFRTDSSMAGQTAIITANLMTVTASKRVEALANMLISRATEFLHRQLDQYHSQYLDVYTDVASAGNHFVHIAKILGGINPALLSVDDACTTLPHSGRTCIRNAFLGRLSDWGGVYRMNGVLASNDTQPRDNWGTVPDAGLDLSGASSLRFWARGERGGERVEFFVGGIGRDADTGLPIAPYPDSSPKVSTGFVTLSNQWKEYRIDLEGVDLSSVLGVGWVTNAPLNGGKDVVFYLDDSRFDLARPLEPRFAQSFAPRTSDTAAETIYANLATVYDNSIACIALIAAAEIDRAKLIADALVYAAGHDRYYDDGRLRAGYMAGDLSTFPGWNANGRSATARIPGWWGSVSHEPPAWYEDRAFVGTKTGDLAWAIIALLSYREAAQLSGDDEYLRAAVRLGEWIEANCTDDNPGVTGGDDGWEPSPQHLSWRSVEHNLDTYVAMSRLGNATNDAVWLGRAEQARRFVEDIMWNQADSHFWSGTTDDGATELDIIPLDAQAWAVMAFPEKDYSAALQWAEAHLRTEDGDYAGFAFSTADTSGVWFEGTAYMALAYRLIGDDARAQSYLGTLEKAQVQGTDGNSFGLVAASKDGLQTGFGVTYDRRLHVGATAWAVLAGLGYNPYWGGR